METTTVKAKLHLTPKAPKVASASMEFNLGPSGLVDRSFFVLQPILLEGSCCLAND